MDLATLCRRIRMPEEVTEILSRDYSIAVRGGFHCAGLAHKTIGTWDRGAVRISVGPFNTLRDMQQLADAIAEIGRRQNHPYRR